MTLAEILKWLEQKRDEKDFDTLKSVRDKCRKLIAIKNREWFDDQR